MLAVKQPRADRRRRLLALLALWVGGVQGAERIIEGEARDQRTGALLYIERHACGSTPVRCEVVYLDPRGELIARKHLDYHHGDWSPALFLQDFRAGEDIEVAAPADPSIVVDAGFDNYMRARWQQLSTGEKVAFPFLVAGQEQPFRMVARSVVFPGCDASRLCLEVQPEAWWLRLLLDPIELVYDRSSRRLLLFRGISNIADATGRSHYVEIRYTYQG